MKPNTRAALRLLRVRAADGVTVAEARAAIGSDRFPARVWELIHWHGYEVDRVMERAPNGDRYARYYLRAPRVVPTTGTQIGLALA
jgi:hypothetical protein